MQNLQEIEITIPKVTHCHLCKFYEPQGTRGGLCLKLQVPVVSHWSACCLARSPFTWEETAPRKQDAQLLTTDPELV